MKDRKEDFLQFCQDTGTGDRQTREGYYNGLMKLDDAYVPQDLPGRKITDPQRKGLLKFYRYFTESLLMEKFNGYTAEQFKGNAKRAKQEEGTRSHLKTKDLTPDEVREARDRLDNPALQVFYTLTGYSGARMKHLYEMFAAREKGENLKIEHINGIIRVDVRSISAGTKNEAYFYFPTEMEKAIRTYRNPYGIDYIGKQIAKSGTSDRPVNESSLRKWSVNILLDHMDKDFANAIQGRAPQGVGAQHYFDLAGKAAKYYPEVLSELQKGLPIPDWMKKGAWDTPVSKPGPRKGSPQRGGVKKKQA